MLSNTQAGARSNQAAHMTGGGGATDSRATATIAAAAAAVPRRGIRYFAGLLASLTFMAVLASCGGGGGGSSGGCATIDPNRDTSLPGCPTTTPVVVNPGMTIAVTDASGAAITAIPADRAATVLVVLKNGAGAAVANTLVTFTSTDKTAIFVPAAATALTDANGAARVALPVGTVSGAYTVTASATADSKAVTASANYTVTLPPATSSSLSLLLNDINGNPTTALTPARPGSLVASVRDANGGPVANTVVTFTTTDSSTALVPSTGTALSNAQGVAQVALPVGTLAGGYTATASASVGGKQVIASTSYAVTQPYVPPVTPPAPVPTLALALFDSAGAAAVNIAPDRPGTLVATVKDAAGAAVANALVTFVTNDKTAALTPAGGNVLTDAAGRASVTLGAGTSNGGYTASAGVSVAGTALSAAANYSITLPTLTLAAPVLNPTTLAAGGTASVAATVLSNGAPYAPAQAVAFSSPCAAAGKARLGTPVTSVNGVATTSYTDLGCGAADVITASLSYNGASTTSSASLTVQLATAGQLAFVSALPQNIALKGTGGAGRQETSTVTFKVMDRGGNAVSGQLVNFALNTAAGGLTLSPASATSGAGGLVTTSVIAGTVNTPVRVSATLPGTGLSTLSDQLVVSTGVPEQNSFTLGAVTKNIEGGEFNGCPAPYGTIVTARLADHFHNPAPDGTAVSFTAEGGSIDASCLTGLVNTTLTDGTVITQKGTPGECSVRYCAGNPRPLDGRVTVLAYALGEESFVDDNGNNLFDATEKFTDLGDPFRNDRAVTDANANGLDDAWLSGSAVRAAGEQYIDSNGNGGWDQKGNGVYNGVLQTTPNVNSSNANTVHVRQAMVLVLSNSTPAVTLLDQADANGQPVRGTLALAQCTTGTKFANTTRSFRFAIRDNNGTVFATNLKSAHNNDAEWLFDRPGNPLPAGTVIAFSASNGVLLGSASATVQNTNGADSANWVYTVQMISDAQQDATLVCTNTVTSGTLTITVTTPGGRISTFTYPVTD